MKAELSTIEKRAEHFLGRHFVGKDYGPPLRGDFALLSESASVDLYGMADAVHILHTLGTLAQETDRSSRERWAEQLLGCQDDGGWFSRRNVRGHSHEHATAYAISALRLLEVDTEERYASQVSRIDHIKPILTDQHALLDWITRLDSRLTPWDVLKKKLGWHYIWRGSHVGGGIPAAIGMTRDLIEQWWGGEVDVDQWFNWYFDWLDAHINPKTGYWQRAFWNTVYRKPTLIDMGGAVHFLWIYEAMGRPFPYPEAIIDSTLSLQRPSGLYKDHPFCIDLDANFCLVRSFLQLSSTRQEIYRERVYRAAERNFEAIVKALTTQPLEEIYDDSHGLPGALAALVECTKLPSFKYGEALSEWQHPLDKAWWL